MTEEPLAFWKQSAEYDVAHHPHADLRKYASLWLDSLAEIDTLQRRIAELETSLAGEHEAWVSGRWTSEEGAAKIRQQTATAILREIGNIAHNIEDSVLVDLRDICERHGAT